MLTFRSITSKIPMRSWRTWLVIMRTKEVDGGAYDSILVAVPIDHGDGRWSAGCLCVDVGMCVFGGVRIAAQVC